MILYCDITDFRSLADKMYVIKVWRLELVNQRRISNTMNKGKRTKLDKSMQKTQNTEN
jgi:hypothetical protein